MALIYLAISVFVLGLLKWLWKRKPWKKHHIKPVPGYKRMYGCDRDGNVYSFHGGEMTLMTQQQGKNEYMYVALRRKGRAKTWLVHRLMAHTFLKLKKGRVVNHIDGCKSNNTLKNLEVITQSENIKHAWSTGLVKSRDKQKNLH